MSSIEEISKYNDAVLIPGDKFIVKEGMTLPCDAILLSGKVLVDESMLTGESVPVCKVPIDVNSLSGSEKINPVTLKECRIPSTLPTKEEEIDPYMKMTGNILFSGTKAKVIYGDTCIAVAYKTSFRSAKGQLVASLLKPKEGFVTFISDALNAIFCMLVLVTFFYVITAYLLLEHHLPWGEVLFRYLDAISIAVPPALTACLTISTAISIERLKLKNIFVADTTRVNFAGVISAVCFDKTGTLTESDLQFVGVYCRRKEQQNSLNNNEMMRTISEDVTALSSLSEFEKYELSSSSSKKISPTRRSESLAITNATNAEEGGRVSPLGAMEEGEGEGASTHNRDRILSKIPFLCQEIMATCHSLAFEKGSNRVPIGDPLEVELFQTSLWSLHQSSTNNGQFYAIPPSISSHESNNYEIIKHFEFTPERLRAASLVKEPSGRIMYLLKGSPEIIVKMSVPSSLPIGIHEQLGTLARKGYRVIALAVKQCLPEEVSLSQEEIERAESLPNASPLYFYGLVYLSSALKEDTKKTIHSLRNANIHVNMITGDHINTAIAVASDCGIIRKTPVAVRKARRKHHQGREEEEEKEEYVTYIIDEDNHGVIKVYDALTGDELSDMTLPKAVYLAGQTYLYQYLEVLHYCYTSPSSSNMIVNALNRLQHSNDINNAQTSISVTSVLNPISERSSMSGVLSGISGVTGGRSGTGGSSRSNKLKKFELAMTGKALRNLQRHSFNRDLLRQAIHFTRIFARMKPHDKRYVVESLKETKQYELVDYDPSEDDMVDIETGQSLSYRLTNSSQDDWEKGLVGGNNRMSSSSNRSDSARLQQHQALATDSPPATTAESRVKNTRVLATTTNPLSSHVGGSTSPMNSPKRAGLKKLHSASSFHSNHSLTSEHKQLKTYGDPYDVLFCGDGANDMVALRAATIGVSLCDAETSVAAPITSKIQTPGSVIDVMIEGRCSLITAYVLILFTLMYGCIQLYFTLELYYFGLIVGDNMYIIQDMVYTLVLGYTMCKAYAYPILSIQQPPKRFLISQNISKFFMMIFWFLIFQVIAVYLLTLQSFYTAYENDDDPLTETYSYESSVIFNISLGQIMIASITACIDEPFREHWSKNRYHTILLLIEGIWLLIQIFVQNSKFLQQTIQIKPVPIEFGCIEVALLLLHYFISIGSIYTIDWLYEVKWDNHWSNEFQFQKIQKILKNCSKLIDNNGNNNTTSSYSLFSNTNNNRGGGERGSLSSAAAAASVLSLVRPSSGSGKVITSAVEERLSSSSSSVSGAVKEEKEGSNSPKAPWSPFSNYSKLVTGSGSDASSDIVKEES